WWFRGRPLPEPLKGLIAELQMRQNADVLAHPAEVLHAGFAALARLGLGREGKPGHRKQEARIHTVVAGLDTFATEHAGFRPCLRFFRPLGETHDVEHTRHDPLRIGIAEARRLRDRARGETRAAFCAGVEHVADATVESGLKARTI